MKIIQLATALIFASVLLFLAAMPIKASEGTVELHSTIGQASRCFATSVLMRDNNYSVVVSCRDLTYPPAVDIFSYILWATAIKDGKPIKFGELGVGKAEFRTPSAFSDLFVTRERDIKVQSPSENPIMQGGVQFIGSLESPTNPEPGLEKPTPTISAPKVTPQDSGLSSKLRRAFLTLFIAVFGLAIVIFAVISTFRRLRE